MPHALELQHYAETKARDRQWAGIQDGVLGHIKKDIICAASGGSFHSIALPTREAWDAMLARYAPGCGSPTHVAGTNGGQMPCGGKLRQLDGSVTQQFCPRCEDELFTIKDIVPTL